VTSTDPAGNTVVLDVGGPGALYGEIAVVSGRRRMADVVALADLVVRRIDALSFHHFLHQHPAATYELLIQTSSRLAAAQQQRTHTRAPETLTRVARRLASLVDACGIATDNGWEVVINRSITGTNAADPRVSSRLDEGCCER
jgi:CRP/FNR family cyclic AMP-dependent transcriptional regulator